MEYKDKNLLWLIRKYLKAGIMEQGNSEPTEEGSGQGLMPEALTLWFKLVVQREMQGECFLVLRMILLQDFNISQKLKDL